MQIYKANVFRYIEEICIASFRDSVRRQGWPSCEVDQNDRFKEWVGDNQQAEQDQQADHDQQADQQADHDPTTACIASPQPVTHFSWLSDPLLAHWEQVGRRWEQQQ